MIKLHFGATCLKTCDTADKASSVSVVGLECTQGISVEQGKIFSILFYCLDENGYATVNDKPEFPLLLKHCAFWKKGSNGEGEVVVVVGELTNVKGGRHRLVEKEFPDQGLSPGNSNITFNYQNQNENNV